MSGRTDYLQELIQNNIIDQAIKLVRDEKDYQDSEGLAATVLGEEGSPAELIDAALEAFLGTRKNRYQQHGYWVHSLSHFTSHLWERRLTDWIKRFNEVAFRGANELSDSNCSDRLVADFGRYAAWSDNPVDFHLTSENLSWMRWEYYGYAKARITSGTFESEEAFLRWQLQQPCMLYGSDDNTIHPEAVKQLEVEGIAGIVQRLIGTGADVMDLKGYERQLANTCLDALRATITQSKPVDGHRKWCEHRVAEIETMAAQGFLTD